MMSVTSKRGSVSIQTAIMLPVFLTLVFFVFEVTRFFFVNVQLLNILEQVALQSKTGENRNISANAKALAAGFDPRLIDPARLEIAAFSASGIAGIAGSTTAGPGGPGDVVRYEMRYRHSFFGNFGERAWEPMNLEFVEIRRNEPDW